MDNKATIKQGTIAFWIESNKLIYNDNKNSVIFTLNPEGGSIYMNKDENNTLHVAYVVLGKGTIDLYYDVSELDPNRAHMIAFTRNIENMLSLYVDGKLVCSKNIEFSKN